MYKYVKTYDHICIYVLNKLYTYTHVYIYICVIM